jgi:hypothetical protein
LEKELGATYEEDLDAMLPKCDIIVINTPLTEKTRYNFKIETRCFILRIIEFFDHFTLMSSDC